MSLSLVNGSFGAIGANGDSKWRQWMLHCRQWRFGEWRQWRSQSPLAPFKWRHLIHSMAILRSQSPFRVSGSFGDPMAPIDPVAPLTTMATMAIHLRQWCQWRQWSKWRLWRSIGDNGANGTNGTNDTNSDNGCSIGANGDSVSGANGDQNRH